LFPEYPFFRDTVPCASKFQVLQFQSPPRLFYPSIPALISDERFLHHTTPPFGISLTRSLLNLYTSRTCINIMLLLNLSCVFTRTPQCGCRHSCRLGLMCNPNLCAESTYRGISKDTGCRENATRTERLFSLRSPSGINLEKQCWSTSAFRQALNKLTVEYITNEVGLLSIRCLLWPALRPFSK